jgi:chaperonin GroEL
MMLADGVRSVLDDVLDAIRSQAQPIRDEDALAAVALTAMGERDLAAMIAELRWLLGPEGHVTIDRFVAPYLERRYISGVQFKAEIASMYFYTEPPKRRAVLANPLVAISEDPVNTVDEALPIMEAALKRGAKALLIVAKSFSGAGLNLLASNNQLPADKKKLDLLACRTTLVGAERTWTLKDLALLTDATILGASYPRSSSFVRPEDLGVAQRAEFTKDLLVVATSGASRAAVQEEAAQLQARAAQMFYDAEERKLLTRRISTLTGGVAELKIGADSQPQRELLNSKAERGLKVVAAAQRSGVVAGAGAALIHAGRAINHGSATGDKALGVELLKRALAAPLRQIAVNAGAESPEGIVQRVRDAKAPTTFDAFSHNVVDAHHVGILDAAELVATVLQTAVSAGLMALTTDAIVYHRKPKQSLEP